MVRNYVDISGALHRELFKYSKDMDVYRISRPKLDTFVGLLTDELQHMKRGEKIMKKIVVMMKLELPGYNDEDVVDLSAESLGEMVFQSDIPLQNLSIVSWRVEEQHG